jgi:alkylhydroperoxidase family enzyme
MRIPPWTPALKAQPHELVAAIEARRGGKLTALDTALLWSEPLARGWNVYLKAVRTELAADRRLRELAICTVALLTGADYEYHHHAPDFLKAGGTQLQLDALAAHVKLHPCLAVTEYGLNAIEKAVIQYAAQMTLQVKVQDTVFAQMQQHFDTTALVEITSSIATYNMVARFLVALDIQPKLAA